MVVNVGGIIGVVVFYALILAIGIWAAWYGKKQNKGQTNESGLTNVEEGQMLAGRNIGWIVGSFTMTATWVGGGYINGTTEAIYRPDKGLIWLQAPFGYALSLAFGAIFFVRTIRERKYVTMIDPFQEKYGNFVGAIIYIPAFIGELLWAAFILAALGSTIFVILGLNETWSVIASAGIALSYTVVGGLYSVAYTDIIQLLSIFFGLWLCVPFALTNKEVDNILENTGWIGTWDWSYAGIWIDISLHLIFGGIPWQVYFQRVLSSKSTGRAIGLSYIGSIGCIVMIIPAILMGCAAYGVNDWRRLGYHSVSPIAANEIKHTLPLAMQYLTPSYISWCGLGAISAAVMSSADSIILSVSSMLSRNIYKNIFRPKASEMELNIVTKINLLLVAIAAGLIGLNINSISSLFVIASDLIYVVLFPQLVCVLFVECSNSYGSIIGFFFTFVIRCLSGESTLKIPALIKFPFYNEEHMEQYFPFRTALMCSGLLLIPLTSILMRYLFTTEVLPERLDVFQTFSKKNSRDTQDDTSSSSNKRVTTL